MSIFTTILSKIFPDQAPAASSAPPPISPPSMAEAAPDAGRGADIGASSGAAAGSAFGGPSSLPSTPANQPVSTRSATPVDVAAVMNQLAASNPENLDWKRSIVDLMKLLDMDSSLASRKELAAELHYSGNAGDSAKMNVWLHQQVLKKLAENGGKVPSDLLV